MRRWIFSSLVLTVAWLFVRGAHPENFAEELVTGALLSFPTIYIFRNMFKGETDPKEVAKDILPVSRYVARFIFELLTANFDVAKRVLLPSMPIDPEIIEIHLKTENPTAITVLANSITLTPGTLTLDHNHKSNSLYVHAIDGSDKNAIEEPIRYWEEKLMKITGEIQ